MPIALPRPGPGEHLEYYARYIARVSGDDALVALGVSPAPLIARLAGADPARGAQRYAEDKWTVTQVVQHVADAERVFAYRALRFARADTTSLPGWDETKWMPYAGAERRTLDDALAEFATVRAATLSLFRSLPPEATSRIGVANDAPVSVRALAWIIAGHELHHLVVLRERYDM
ncbi:MAG: DinB family protein [Candidatus Eisenbacteria bacterium]